ncbi:hypothetical protein EW146_g9178 [Bondarzewia mesenterica]|uniref:cellulase n=1 Tax=Bondarzewia mesenterica TaxID=1095465 RepID=A0A4S4L8U8_9AGAM|nr:hypothetical protein EW146_g9178 [Bondarzewia mesenterica]
MEPGSASNLSGWQQEAERYFDRIVSGTGPSYTTSGALLWYNGDSDDASLNPVLNAAMLLTRYAQIATTSGRRTSYLSFAQNQLDYALGKNSMSFDSNSNSPSNPHSAMASDGNDITQLDTSPTQEAYVLYGAVIGGPNKQDWFFNIHSDWPETEVALDYNAPLLTLAAAHALTDTADPYFTQLQAGAYDARKPSGTPCDPAFPASAPPADLLAVHLTHVLRYQPGERDLVLLAHEFVARSGQVEDVHTCTLVVYGDKRASAMARTVRLPVALVALPVLDSAVLSRGIRGPTYDESVWKAVLEGLEERGLGIKEDVKNAGEAGMEGGLLDGLERMIRESV